MCNYPVENGKAPCCKHDCEGCVWYREDDDEERISDG